MILNNLPISAYSGVLKFDMKIFVNVARLEIGQLFTEGTKRGQPCTLDTFLVFSSHKAECKSVSFPSVGRLFNVQCIFDCTYIYNKLDAVARSDVRYDDGLGFDPHVRQHSLVEIGHEIISRAILCLLLIQEGQ